MKYELNTVDPFDKYSAQTVETITELWDNKEETIGTWHNKLNSAFTESKVSKEEELECWLEFISYPTSIIFLSNESKFRPLILLKNVFSKLLSSMNVDYKSVHSILRQQQNIELRTSIDSNHIYNAVENLLAESIKLYLDGLDVTEKKRRSKGDGLTILAKVHLLDKLGFFELIQNNGLKTSTDIGKLVSLILDTDETNTRKMVSNVLEPGATTNESFNPNSEFIHQQVLNTLSLKFPSISLYNGWSKNTDTPK